ncbi:nitric-oxide reductase large subunit [Limnochorda pilosa]|uniref:Nitric oxide reductase n=1 Tax=Limnochorda pilosa TaxID=1555112 RepID=A0A0K2SN74_LIMPI|nr:cbb3-type cytochrome c oxidase subunit I [Limnochorda pilosa]BAS28583.1 nitric oxide reductase [Limnochorda pilosa]
MDRSRQGTKLSEGRESTRSGFWKYGLILALLLSMSVLVFGGLQSFDKAAPVPEQVVAPGGQVLFTADEIWAGQALYQQNGLMDLGSVLGNGSYRGPDFTAESLHQMVLGMRAAYARQQHGLAYDRLDEAAQAAIDAQVARELKANRYDEATGTLTLTPGQVAALQDLETYWDRILTEGSDAMGIRPGLIRATTTGDGEGVVIRTTGEAIQVMSRYFFWTAWASAASRPGEAYSYTNNWPYEVGAGNVVTWGSIWSSALSVALLVLLTAGVLLVFFRGRLSMDAAANPNPPQPQQLPVTPSQRTVAYFIALVAGLFLTQTLLGGYLAHSFSEPTFFGLDLEPLLPFQVARGWHLQLAIFWIATAWMAAGLYIAPLVSRSEVRGQNLLVKILLGALVVVAVGSLLGEWLGVQGRLGRLWWWLGFQGWEYLELGRIWQVLLIAGLGIWLFLLFRAMRRALAREGDWGSLTHLLLYAAVLIPAFYSFGLFNTPTTHVTLAEYWRWFVIHLWVEGIFEVFTVVVVAVLFTAMGLVTQRSALRASYFQLILVLPTGVIGTAHHYYFTGMPEIWLALGATFSALEVIPLTLLGIEAYEQYRLIRKLGKPFAFRGSFYFLMATAFWNLFGAGVLGFLINLPVVNYFEHGSTLTTAHGHAALAGVYGMLAVALSLFVLRALSTDRGWSERAVKLSFWGLNGGLLGVVLLTLVPVGLGQLGVAVREGFWAARNGLFYQVPWVNALLWLRMLPDTVFIVAGVVPFLYLALRVVRNRRAVTLAEAESLPDEQAEAAGRTA